MKKENFPGWPRFRENGKSVRLILDTYRSDQFMIVKLVGEHQPSLSRRDFSSIFAPAGILNVRFEKKTVSTA